MVWSAISETCAASATCCFVLCTCTCRRRVGLEVEGAGLRETLRTLKGLCAALELDATERRSTLAALRAKQRQMKQFSHLTVSDIETNKLFKCYSLPPSF